jgi:high-affinity iron transporter
MIYAVHEFFEAGAVPGLDNAFWHLATEPYGPEGVYGQWLSYLMVMIPAVWLAGLWGRDRLARRSTGADPAQRPHGTRTEASRAAG